MKALVLAFAILLTGCSFVADMAEANREGTHSLAVKVLARDCEPLYARAHTSSDSLIVDTYRPGTESCWELRAWAEETR